jgi:galactarate dehydratase (D-threo-forming)
MKIDRVHLYPIITPRETGVTNQHILVRLDSADGATGWGEMSDLSHLPMHQVDWPALEEQLRALLVGQDAANLAQREDHLLRAFPEEGYKYSRSGSVRQGVDAALLDLVGRAQGLPVHDLLGGQLRDRIRVCYPFFAMRSVAQAEQSLVRLREKRAEGFDLIRVYVGANPQADAVFLQGVAEQLAGQVSVKSLDFSNALDWRRAWTLTERYAELVDFMLVESVAPAHDLDGLAEYRRRSRWPVSEHVYHLFHGWQLLSRGCVDILNISPYLLGGLQACLRLLALAEAARASVLIGTTQELSLGTAAIAHLGAAARVLDYPSDSTGRRLYTADVTRTPVQYAAGYLQVPTGPGLGIEVDEALVAELSGTWRWTYGTNFAAARDRTVS